MRKPPVDPLIGRTIGGRYRLIQRLGSGGMSSVYLARHVLIDRLMAIKTLRRDLASDPVQRDRFLREARAVNRINHENIVEISDFRETEDGLLYLVMEYVPGESLLKAMASGPFPPVRAFDIAEQTASALARAHQMGVIHRDLKPENILLVQRRDRPDFVKLLDFGIAKLTDQPSLTGSQQIFGTPGYIAPEYIQASNIDGRSDLYSLGVILYEMVTGALPFDYEYPGDLLIKHVTEPPIRPSARRPGLPAAVEELVLRCLEKSPDRRFRDAFHFLEELRACRERLGSDLTWGAMARPELSSDADRTASSASPVSGASLGSVAARRSAASPQPSEHEPSLGGPADENIDIPVEVAVEPADASHSPVGRAVTADFDRRSIPVAPAEDLSIHVDVEVPSAPPPAFCAASTAGPGSGAASASGEHGLAGTRRWRERFEALRACLDELVEMRAPPPEVDAAMAFAARTLEELEESAESARREQRALERVSEKARDFRTTIGRTLDELAAQLSHERGEIEALEARRRALEERRSELRSEGRETEADGVLWEIAAVEQTTREKTVLYEVLAAQVAELQARLDRENEQLDGELAVLSRSLEREMERLWPMAAALREPLDRVERYVREAWRAAAQR